MQKETRSQESTQATWPPVCLLETFCPLHQVTKWVIRDKAPQRSLHVTEQRTGKGDENKWIGRFSSNTLFLSILMSKQTQSLSDAQRKPKAFKVYSFYSDQSNLYIFNIAFLPPQGKSPNFCLVENSLRCKRPKLLNKQSRWENSFC